MRPLATRKCSAKFTPARYMKRIVTHWLNGENAAIDAFFVLNPPVAMVEAITLENTESKEVHAVTVGDYFKYKGTVSFMETLAKANNGGFLALSQ